MRKSLLSISLLALVSTQVLAQAVKHYEKAPSVEEAERQLFGNDGGAKADVSRKPRKRKIDWDNDPAEVVPNQEQAALVPPQCMQVGERAMAFPINFRVNSSEVMPESELFIESVAKLMRKNPHVRILIEGHTDSTGGVVRNTALSRERAFSVMNHLIDHYGIDAIRLVPVGRGSSELLGDAHPTSPRNRRVQFRVIS